MASFDEDAILYDLNVVSEWSTEQEEDAVKDQLKRHPFTGISWSRMAVQRVKSFLGRSSNTADVFIRLHCVRSGVLVSLSAKERYLLAVRGASIDLFDLSEPSMEQPTLTLRLPMTETFSQWLTSAWSDSGNHFALSGPELGVHVYSVRGALVASVKPPEEQVVDRDDALVTALALHELDANGRRLMLTCFHFSARIVNFEIDVEGGGGSCKLLSSLHLGEKVPLRLLCAEAALDSDVLAIGTTACALPSVSPSTQRGLLFLRRISEAPHLQLTPTCQKDFDLLLGQNFLSRMMLSDAMDAVCHLSLAPSREKLAAVHTSGAVSLWSFPSGMLLHTLELRLQPFHEAMSPLLSERVFSSWSRRVLPCLPSNRPTCLTWWDSDSLVVSRENGSVAVWSKRFESRTGDRPEWFEPYVQLAPVAGAPEALGFFLLDCDSRRRRPEEEAAPAVDVSDEEEDEDEDEDEDREEGFLWFALRRGGRAVKRAMGWGGTPRSARKRMRLVETTYRLIRFSSTTPEQLFQRKIEAEEYGEALALSQRYPGLDPDLVLQRQWHRSQMSRAAIEDFLMRIGKHSWVLHECLERVPQDLDSTRSLLELGLRATDVDAFAAAADSAESGRLILTDPSMMLEGGDWTATTAEETARCYREKKLASVEELLGGRLAWDRLSLQQHELLRQRHRLLDLLDRLDAFEEVLGGKHRAPDRFSAEAFAKFRAVDPLRAAVTFARDTDLLGLEVMLTQFWPRLRPHRLLLLSNIPETESPRLYERLLPRPGQRLDGEEVLPWDPVLRDSDWSEELLAEGGPGHAIEEAVQRTADRLYEESADLAPFRTAHLTQGLLTEWFLQRAQEMERMAGQVSCALELLDLGRQLGVSGLEDLRANLELLATLVYECGVADPRLSLAVLEGLSRLERLRLIMSVAVPGDGERFVRVLARWALPFLERAPARWNVLRHFLVERAALPSGLADVRALFDAVSRDAVRLASLCGASGPDEVAALAAAGVECCYASPESDQLSQAQGVAAAISKLRAGAPSESFRLLESHLEAAVIAQRYREPRALRFFREEADEHSVEALLRAVVAKHLRDPAALTSREADSLLQDLRGFLTRALPAATSKDRPARLLAEGLLRAGPAGLKLAARYLQLCPDQPCSANRLNFEEAAQVVAAAAGELFDTATSASDDAARDARACLELLKSPHAAVQRELRLAEGVALLADLGAALLPAEVRRHPDRAALLRKCLRTNPALLQQSEKAVRAGVALDIAGKDSEAAALCLLADAALEQKASEPALEVARRLALHFAFPPSWRQCELVADLAASSGLPSERWRPLVDFALTHCPPSELPRVTLFAARLESALLRRREAEGGGDGGQLVGGLLKAAALLRPLHRAGSPDKEEMEEKEEEPEEEEEGPLSASWVSSAFFSPSSNGCTAASLLRSARLQEAAEGAAELGQWEPLFFRLARAAQARDSALFVAAAARLSDPALLDRLATRMPESSANYDLVLRAICLALLLPRGEAPELQEASLEQLSGAVQNCQLAPDQRALFDKFAARRRDFSQAQRLLAVVPGLSLRRFQEDAAFREDTVLGLAMAEEDAHLALACELAERYGIARWDLRLAHLEFLLTESQREAAWLGARIEELHLRSELFDQEPQRFLEAMRAKIWPLLAGNDHPRLELFLSLLPPEAELASMSAAEHGKVLKKLRAAAPAVDYKALVAGGDPLRALAPHLNSGNVHVFAKLAPNWRSEEDQGPLKPSAVFSLWTGRLFWKEEAAPSDWVHRFEQCGPFFARLLPLDFLSFLREAVFSPASKQVGLEARREILRRAGRLCRQQAAGAATQQKGKRRRGAHDEGEAFRWSEASAEVQAYQAHVDLVEDVLLPRLRELGVAPEELAPFQVLAPGAAFLEQVLTELLLWPVAPRDLGQLAEQLGAAQEALEAAVGGAAQRLVVAGLANLSGARQHLSAMLERAAALTGPLDGRAAVLSAVKALLMEPDIRSRLGLFLVQLLRSYNDGSEDVAAAVVVQAICVLREFFEDRDWDAHALAADPAARLALVTRLVAESESSDAMRALHEAIEILGHVSDQPDNALWSCWVRHAATFADLGDFVIDIFSRRCAAPQEVDARSFEAVQEAVTVFEAGNPRVAFVLCVLSGREELVGRPDTRQLLTPQVCEQLASDQGLLRRLMERGWLHYVIGCELYGSCVELLLDSGDRRLVQRVVQGLKQKGFHLEAYSLLADSQRLHPGLRTLGALSSLWSKFAST